jgi:hypothetical protein
VSDLYAASVSASARKDFHQARQQAALEEILARLTGKSADLLCYPDIREQLGIEGSRSGGLKDIPVDAIVGSLGRCSDFTRSFLPRQAIDQQRWTRVETDLVKWPPIQVYQVGQVYFVQDGHHRVSVARQLGHSHIQAYVTEVRARAPLSPESQPEDLIVQAEYADFLERTHLDELRPEIDLSVSVPGQYRMLEEHIEVHRYYMGLEQERKIPYQEAVVDWYDEVYRPVAEAIRDQDILRDFPGRTETDLYLWLSEYRAALEEEWGWEVKPEAAAARLAAQFSSRPRRIIARIGNRILNAVRAGLGKWSRA